MPFDGEPPRGDYAAYIEKLINRGRPAPGAVGRLSQVTRRIEPDPFGEQRTAPLDPGVPPAQTYPRGVPSPAESGFDARPEPPPEVPYAADDPGLAGEPSSGADTLASRAGAGISGLLQLGFGALTGLVALTLVADLVFAEEAADFGTLLSFAILLVITRFFLSRGLAAWRRSKRLPERRLPPLHNPTGRRA